MVAAASTTLRTATMATRLRPKRFIRSGSTPMLSKHLGAEDEGPAEPEASEISANDVGIADDERGQPAGVEVPGHYIRDIVGRDPLRARHVLVEVVVRQIVERELRNGACDLIGRLEVPRVSARQRRDTE